MDVSGGSGGASYYLNEDPATDGEVGVLTHLDLDGDGLSEAEEAAALTDPLDPDTDDDGLPDGFEGPLGTNPL
jgi:hypothetical protein